MKKSVKASPNTALNEGNVSSKFCPLLCKLQRREMTTFEILMTKLGKDISQSYILGPYFGAISSNPVVANFSANITSKDNLDDSDADCATVYRQVTFPVKFATFIAKSLKQIIFSAIVVLQSIKDLFSL